MTNRRNATLWLGALLAALLCVAAAVLVQPALAQANDESENETQALLEYEQNTIDIVDRYSNSVVSILVEVAGQRVDPFKGIPEGQIPPLDRKSTRLNSSHVAISYAVFCLKKK